MSNIKGKCPVCSTNSESIWNMNNTKTEAHRVVWGFKCPSCETKFFISCNANTYEIKTRLLDYRAKENVE